MICYVIKIMIISNYKNYNFCMIKKQSIVHNPKHYSFHPKVVISVKN